METTTDLRDPLDPPETPPAPSCPSDALLRALWGQWKLHVIYTLGAHGPSRFGVLRRAIPTISPKVLTQRLRELESDGLAWREQVNTIPPQVTYGLTPIGESVHRVLKEFDPIAAAWAKETGRPR
ncbi:transcriptional regulator [Palleronia sediminis]|uniref:Transcriptional regulator n=1 Tax=Palleronia sediminis TaxID=2547833 RepID=A0A4R6AA62_9RHOB|nr:helix-turn-helix domain-containing protein [Palleronia sediminis]TDL78146.1 transcriptional regulator [Palleronia sediminis]